MRYLCLLRGINVGGKARVEMARLRELFTEMGFTDVLTYINSGNVIFSSEEIPNVSNIQQRFVAVFGFDIPTLIIGIKQFAQIAAAIPETWENNYTDQKSDVVFLFPEIDSPDILIKIGYRSDVETIIYTPGALLCNVPRKNQSKSSLMKVIGTPLYASMTVRNVTTVRKLAALARKQ